MVIKQRLHREAQSYTEKNKMWQWNKKINVNKENLCETQCFFELFVL